MKTVVYRFMLKFFRVCSNCVKPTSFCKNNKKGFQPVTRKWFFKDV